MPKIYENVEGWFNWEWLYDREVEKAKDGDKFIEIGTWYGRSAIYMAELIKESGKDLTMYCIDPYGYGLHGKDSFNPNDLKRLSEFLRVLYSNNLQDYLIPVIAKSERAAHMFLMQSVNMVYVDGDHSYEGCLSDIDLYYPRVKTGGVIAGHDYGREDFPGLNKAVEQASKQLGREFQTEKDTWYFDNIRTK